MRKIISLISVLLLILQSCSSGDNNSNSNSISSPFTVKYEIISTSQVRASYNSPMITYNNSTNQTQTESVTNLTATTPWSKTVDITTTTRPLQLSLLISGNNPNYYLILANAGSITQNLYINGVLKASSTNQSDSQPSLGSWYRITIPAITYTVN
jgi:hypothetical protein